MNERPTNYSKKSYKHYLAPMDVEEVVNGDPFDGPFCWYDPEQDEMSDDPFDEEN